MLPGKSASDSILYIFNRYSAGLRGTSVLSFVIAIVLASGTEEAMRQGQLLLDSCCFVFFERPVPLAIFAIDS